MKDYDFECEDCGWMWEDLWDGDPGTRPVCPECGGSNLFEDELEEERDE